MNFGKFLEDKSVLNGNKTFLYFKDLSVSYIQINEYANKCANLFKDLGVKTGDKVALMLPNCPEFLYAWFGLSKIGAVEVPINSRLIGQPLFHQIYHTECKGIVTSYDLLSSFNGFEDYIEKLDFVLIIDWDSEQKDNLFSFRRLISVASAVAPGEVLLPKGQPISIMFTSGTTGVAKGVVNSHDAYLAAGHDIARIMGVTSDDRCYVCLPLFHGNPQMMVVMTTLAANCAMILAEKFSASQFWSDIERYQATFFSYVGTILAILCKQPVRDGEGNNTVRFCFGGGAPNPVWEEFRRRFNVEILEAFGMIEAGCVTTINNPGEVRFGSVGKIRECFDVKLLNEDDEEVTVGEIGEIAVRPLRPYYMFSGYYRAPEETLDSYRNLWFHTGDLGWRDKDGYHYFSGRKKHVIRRNGENISPYEIEEVINSNPNVLECAVVGVSDEIAGEEIKACVVLKPGTQLRPVEIINWCEGKLAKFMLPRYIHIKDTIEKTASEKIQVFKLKEEGIKNAWDSKKDKEVESP